MSKKSRRPARAAVRTAGIQPGTPAPRISGGLIWVLAAALIVRIVHLLQSRQSPFFEPLLLDPGYYHGWAQRIVRGDLGGVFYGLPLYPFFLAFIYKIFGVSILTVKWTQLFLGLATVYLVYGIGKKLFSERAGLWAALLAAVYGPLFFHETIFIAESLGVPLYAGAFLAALYFFDRPNIRKAAMLGVLFGLAALSKAGILPFVPAYLAYFLWKSPASGKAGTAAACAACFLLTLAPVTAHNVIRGKDFVLLTAHSGFNFYVGNHPDAQGVFSAPEGTGTNVEAQKEDSYAIAERAVGRSLKPSEVSRYWSGEAWRAIRENPTRFLRLCLRKLAIFFDAREISDVEDYHFQKNFVPFLRFPWPSFAVLGPLVFMGLAFARRTRYRTLIYLWTGCYLIGMTAFFVNARYRLPMLPVFFALAAFAAERAMELSKAGPRRELILGIAALAAGIGVSQLHLVGTDFSRDYLNAADAYVEMKEPRKALPFYDRALEIKPDYAKASLGKALCLTRLDRHEEAAVYYRKAIDLDPRNSQAWNNLGMWHDRNGDLEQAEMHFLKAIALKPSSSQAHNNLGMVYGKRGDLERAASEFEKSLKIEPDSARVTTNLGLILWKRGDRAEAERLWRKALTLDPQFPEALKALRLLDSFDSQ